MTYIYLTKRNNQVIAGALQARHSFEALHNARLEAARRGEPVELDPIALCCEYTEYNDFEELQSQYPDIKDMEDLSNYTTVIPVDNAMKTDSFIILNF